jgi:ribosome maturation factor RimP
MIQAGSRECGLWSGLEKRKAATRARIENDMDIKTQSLVKQVERFVEPILEQMGYELVDVEYFSSYGRWILRLFVDSEGGVTIGDCARISEELGDLIDVKEFIRHEYNLEVSSPGLDRPLRKEKDLSRALGKRVKVRMAAPLEGRRNFTGILLRYGEGILSLEVDGQEVGLPWAEVAKANLIYEFKSTGGEKAS